MSGGLSSPIEHSAAIMCLSDNGTLETGQYPITGESCQLDRVLNSSTEREFTNTVPFGELIGTVAERRDRPVNKRPREPRLAVFFALGPGSTRGYVTGGSLHAREESAEGTPRFSAHLGSGLRFGPELSASLPDGRSPVNKPVGFGLSNVTVSKG